MLGMSVASDGTLRIQPCVPPLWYEQGFGQRGLGLMHQREVQFRYEGNQFRGQGSGKSGVVHLQTQLPPALNADPIRVAVNGELKEEVLESQQVRGTVLARSVSLMVEVTEGKPVDIEIKSRE